MKLYLRCLNTVCVAGEYDAEEKKRTRGSNTQHCVCVFTSQSYFIRTDSLRVLFVYYTITFYLQINKLSVQFSFTFNLYVYIHGARNE